MKLLYLTTDLRISVPNNQHMLTSNKLRNVLDLYISNSEDLVSQYVSVSNTLLSDHRHVDIFLSYNPCSPTHSDPPDFIDSSSSTHYLIP